MPSKSARAHLHDFVRQQAVGYGFVASDFGHRIRVCRRLRDIASRGQDSHGERFVGCCAHTTYRWGVDIYIRELTACTIVDRY